MKIRKRNIRRLLAVMMLSQLPVGYAMAGDTQVVQSAMQQISLPAGSVSNDSLFRQYVEQRFNEVLPGYQPQVRSTTRSGYDRLSKYDAKFYEALATRIRTVASGQETDTWFSIPVSEVYPGCGPYTADQLGVSALAYTQEVEDRVNELFSIDYMSLVFALLDDMPLELFWFDKTNTFNISTCPTYTIANGKLTLTGTMDAKMNVAKDYAASGTAGTHVVRNDLSKVTTAITNAQDLVSQVSAIASEYSFTTKEILEYYMLEICNMVNYDFDAPGSAEQSGKPYGDPWQLIGVFDGDPETNVVCEGYSKAFKYLCDLTGFADIECITATGLLGDGSPTPGGPHMWNIVRMDDGRNYLVDLTNADYTQWGGEDAVFPGLLMAYQGEGGTATGSYAGGYNVRYMAGYEQYCSFTYDDLCKSTFGEQALTLSTLPYEAPAKKVNLSDAMDAADVAAQFGSFKGQDGVHVNFRRTSAAAGQPITVCLPFSFPIPAISVGTFYTFGGVEVDDDGQWVATMNAFSGNTLAANTPYILRPAYPTVDFSGDYSIPATVSAGSVTVGHWSLKGTYVPKSWTSDSAKDYGFIPAAGADTGGNYLDAGTFVKVTTGASVAPLRCYLSYTGRAASRSEAVPLPESIKVLFVDAQGQTTGIGSLNVSTGEVKADVWYDLQGRRLPGRPSGKGVYILNGRKVVVDADK